MLPTDPTFFVNVDIIVLFLYRFHKKIAGHVTVQARTRRWAGVLSME